MNRVLIEASSAGTFFCVNEGTDKNPHWIRELLPKGASVLLNVTEDHIKMKVIFEERDQAASP